MNFKVFFKSNLFFILLIFALAAVNVFLKFSFFEPVFSTDSHEYIAAGNFFASQPDVQLAPHRLLKPLAPYFMALVAKTTGIGMLDALLLQAVIFYFAGGLAVYFFLKKFFENEAWPAFWGALLYLSAYPMLKYGLDLMIETGAWFFYALGIMSAYSFYKNPDYRNLFLALGISIVGFFWKEYSALNLILLALIIFFHPIIDRGKKLKMILLSIGASLIFILPWQLYIYQTFHYSFFDWLGGGSFFASRSTDYDFYHIVKSLFGVMMLAWILVLLGVLQWQKLSSDQRVLIKLLSFVSFLFLLWGSVSSRLYFVLAPAAIILALFGLKRLSNRWIYQVLFVLLIIAGNYFWLALSSAIY